MSKRGAAIAVVFCLVGVGAAIAVTSPDKIDLIRGATGIAGAKAQSNDKPAEKRWLAVAPGRVEPPSGMIKVAAPTMGVVSKVLVKVNDTVFAGEPLVLLNDDEIQSRYLAAEIPGRHAQAACATSSPRPARRPTAARSRTRWPMARPRCSTPDGDGRQGGDRLACRQRLQRSPDQVRARRWRARRTISPSGRRSFAPAAAMRRCRRRSRRRSRRARRSRVCPGQPGKASDPRADRRHGLAAQHQPRRACDAVPRSSRC